MWRGSLLSRCNGQFDDLEKHREICSITSSTRKTTQLEACVDDTEVEPAHQTPSTTVVKALGGMFQRISLKPPPALIEGLFLGLRLY